MTRSAPTQSHALALALLAVSAFAVADTNLVLAVIALPCVVGAWFLTQPPIGRPLPRVIINLLLLGILAYTFFSVAKSGFSVSRVCEIITLTLIAKILDRRSLHDYGQLLSIAAFLCIGTILTSNSLPVGLLLVACLWLLIVATLKYQIERVSQKAMRRSSSRNTRSIRRLSRVIFFVGLAFSIAFFILIPRKLGAGLFGDWGNPGIGQMTGFSDEVALGTPGFISPSSTPVLDLELTDRLGKPVGGAGQVFYLRGAVLDTYENGRWVRSSSWVDSAQRRQTSHDLRGFPVSSGPRYWTIKQHITIRNAAATRSHLFSIWRPVYLEPSQPSVFYSTNDGTLIRESESGKFEYTVFSREYEKPDRFSTARPRPGQPVHAANMNSERFRLLASELLEKEGLASRPEFRPQDQIDRAAGVLRDYFRTGFIYTLQAEPVPPGKDPIEWFLFDRRAGHCEYYASAMAALGRSVGLNTRVITGYVAAEYNEAAGHYLVRQSNAHAWVEVEVGPGVWHTFDPTPPADFQRLHEPSQSLLARGRRLFDAAEYAWIRGVVDFNSDRQQRFIRSAFNTNWTPDRAVENFVLKLRQGGPKAALMLIGFILLMISIFAVASLLLTRYRAAIIQWVFKAWVTLRTAIFPMRDIDSVYQAFVRDLSHEGTPKPEFTPLLTHIRNTASNRPDQVQELAERLAGTIYRTKFDHPDPGRLRDCRTEFLRYRALRKSHAQGRTGITRTRPRI